MSFVLLLYKWNHYIFIYYIYASIIHRLPSIMVEDKIPSQRVWFQTGLPISPSIVGNSTSPYSERSQPTTIRVSRRRGEVDIANYYRLYEYD